MDNNYEISKKTYLYFIAENLKLITKLLREEDRYSRPYNPDKDYILYIARAKHLQVMTLLGATAEHLINIILLKRGEQIIKTNGYTIDFKISIDIFLKSNLVAYFSELRSYQVTGQGYLGFPEINPENCLIIMKKMRNSYLHKANAQEEENGVIWYFYNFLVWMANTEFNDENLFNSLEYIGSYSIKK